MLQGLVLVLLRHPYLVTRIIMTDHTITIVADIIMAEIIRMDIITLKDKDLEMGITITMDTDTIIEIVIVHA